MTRRYTMQCVFQNQISIMLARRFELDKLSSFSACLPFDTSAISKFSTRFWILCHWRWLKSFPWCRTTPLKNNLVTAPALASAWLGMHFARSDNLSTDVEIASYKTGDSTAETIVQILFEFEIGINFRIFLISIAYIFHMKKPSPERLFLVLANAQLWTVCAEFQDEQSLVHHVAH